MVTCRTRKEKAGGVEGKREAEKGGEKRKKRAKGSEERNGT